MAVDIKVPKGGESITEGVLSRWLKPNGAAVKADEPVAELETDKATQEVNAPSAGVLTTLVAEGQKVSVGAVIGRVDPSAVPASPNGGATPAPARKAEAPALAAAPTGTNADALLSPAARQHAADAGLDPSQLQGSGRGGRVLKEDVLTALQQRGGAASPAPGAPPAPPAPAVPKAAPEAPRRVEGARETRQRMTTIRQRIAERLLAAQQNAAILTTFNEADLSAVTALRAKYKEAFQKKHGVGLGFMSFFVKAVVEALKAFPAVNARVDGGDIVYQHFYDIGVAVSTEKGLMVPVLRDADKLSFADIEKAIAALAQKARDNKIAVGDLQGGTFTITNGGVFGSLLSTPILNPPQSAILGMHAIKKRPVAVDDQVVVRPMMYLALSYDHRLVDGRDSVGFLVRVKECVESPDRLLLDV
jgi:2-oxoglutarate dehydrogenase E2 component (dihydrolipoamide succinyltransferase)